MQKREEEEESATREMPETPMNTRIHIKAEHPNGDHVEFILSAPKTLVQSPLWETIYNETLIDIFEKRNTLKICTNSRLYTWKMITIRIGDVSIEPTT